MKLQDFDQSPLQTAVRALREHYDTNFPVQRLDASAAGSMLRRVRTAMKESMQDGGTVSRRSYMKLVFMEQALTAHLGDLRNRAARIVVENKKVDESTVVVAAKGMCDNIQKMIEDVSDMLVKELPALVSSMDSDIGTDESKQFNEAVSGALKSLQEALSTAKQSLDGAVDAISGEGGFETGMPGEEDMGDEQGMEPPEGGEEMPPPEGGEEMPEPEAEAPPEEPEIPAPRVGRERR